MFPAFVASGFAIAGAALMAGPILIHLLNRNRFKTVHWAAMDFLLEATKSNRRMLRLRDLLLMLLRALAILLFGFALARPYFSSSSSNAANLSKPPHAILIVDNSLSMNLEDVGGSMLDKVKAQAQSLIESLPASHRTSIIPLCGRDGSTNSDPFQTRADALDALTKISATDESGNFTRALNQARAVADQSPAYAPYVVLFSDQQRAQWEQLARSKPAAGSIPVIVAETDRPSAGNASVHQLTLQDGLAEVDTATRVTAQVRYQGLDPRANIAVTFQVRDQDIETRYLDFPAGDTSQAVQFDAVFDAMEVSPFDATTTPVSVKISEDALTADDAQSLIVPLVASVSVVFIDNWSDAEESITEGRLGDTWVLRQLLSPRTDDSARAGLIKPLHLSQREADPATLREVLAGARMCVIAGVASPTPELIQILRSYAQQGGQVAIAASGSFDPVAWSDVGWNQGNGLLPGPLKPEPFGHSLDETVDELKPFRISGQGLLDHSYLRLPELEESQLIDLYTDPLFFKAVALDDSSQTNSQQLAESLPEERWLQWSPPVTRSTSTASESNSIVVTHIATFDNGLDFVTERRIGKGNVVFFSSGVTSDWATLANTNAVLLFDRILRNQLSETFPRFTYPVGSSALLRLPSYAGDSTLELQSPQNGLSQSLTPKFLDDESRGIETPRLSQRGVYWITSPTAGGSVSLGRALKIPVATTSTAWESELEYLDETAFMELEFPENFQWRKSVAQSAQSGSFVMQHAWWKWLVLATIILLILEMMIAASPQLLQMFVGTGDQETDLSGKAA